MKLLRYLIGRVRVMDVCFAADGGWSCAVWRCALRGEAVSEVYDPAVTVKSVSVVVVSGHGVVSKPAENAGIAARVAADPETFLAGQRDGVVSFVRRESLQPLLAELARNGIFPQRIAVAVPPQTAAREFFESLRWRELIRLDEKASLLARSVGRRLAPLLLGAFLLLLGMNAVVAPSLQAERQNLQQLAQTRQRDGSRQAASSGERERIFRDFARRLPVSYAVFCDRVGGCVPEGVRLLSFDVEPLTKRFEAKRPLQRTERSAVIRGRCMASSEVGDFAGRLTDVFPDRAVQLSSVGSRRDGGLEFCIEIRL